MLVIDLLTVGYSSNAVLHEISLEVKPGEMTKDGAFTVETVNCVGACALAPLVIVDTKYHNHVTPVKLRGVLEEARQQDQGSHPDA